jgi:hypothetical protein
MESETAKALVGSIADALSIAIDNRNKLRAIELLLSKHRSDLFQEYEEILAEVRRNPPTSISLEGFGRLQEKLVRE